MSQQTLNIHLPISGNLIILAMSTIRQPTSTRRFVLAYWRGTNTRGMHLEDEDEISRLWMVAPDDIQQELDRALLQSREVVRTRRLLQVGSEFRMWEIEGWGRLCGYWTEGVRGWVWERFEEWVGRMIGVVLMRLMGMWQQPGGMGGGRMMVVVMIGLWVW